MGKKNLHLHITTTHLRTNPASAGRPPNTIARDLDEIWDPPSRWLLDECTSLTWPRTEPGKLIQTRRHRNGLGSDSLNPNPTENPSDAQTRGPPSLPPSKRPAEGEGTSNDEGGSQRAPVVASFSPSCDSLLRFTLSGGSWLSLLATGENGRNWPFSETSTQNDLDLKIFQKLALLHDARG